MMSKVSVRISDEDLLEIKRSSQSRGLSFAEVFRETTHLGVKFQKQVELQILKKEINKKNK